MADAISIQELIDARTDAKTLEEAVNGDAVTTVLSRLGETYPTLSNALNQIDSKLDSADAQIKLGITDLFENGGLPATPFATKALMTASALADGKYAMVTDDTVNNGLYVKTAGAWVKSEYDPLTQAKSYTDTSKSEAIAAAALDATEKANAAKVEANNYTDTELFYASNSIKPDALLPLRNEASKKELDAYFGNYRNGLLIDPAQDSDIQVLTVTNGKKVYESIESKLGALFANPKIVMNKDGNYEWSRHTLLIKTDALDTASAKEGCTFTSGAKSVNGTTSAYLLTNNFASECYVRQGHTADVNRKHVTVSLIVKVVTDATHAFIKDSFGGHALFNLTTGSVGDVVGMYNAKITGLGLGYYHISASYYNGVEGSLYFGISDNNSLVSSKSGLSATIEQVQVNFGGTAQDYLVNPNSGIKVLPTFDYRSGNKAMLVEANRTFGGRYSDDLTQVDWAKSGLSVAISAVSIVNDPCSRLTATTANATALQTITGTIKLMSVFIKRVTGIGAISLTLDGGATWEDVTSQVTTDGYNRIIVVGSGVSYGIKLSSANDVVDVCMFNPTTGYNEASPVPYIEGGDATIKMDSTNVTLPADSDNLLYYKVYVGELKNNLKRYSPAVFYNGATAVRWLSVADGIKLVQYTNPTNVGMGSSSVHKVLEATLRSSASQNNYEASVNGGYALQPKNTSPVLIDKLNLNIFNSGNKSFEKILLINEDIKDYDITRFKYDDELKKRGDSITTFVTKEKQFAGTTMMREPTLFVLSDDGDSVEFLVTHMNKNIVDFGHSEAPARLMQRKIKYSKRTNEFTYMTPTQVMYEHDTWSEGKGHNQSPAVIRVKNGSNAGRLICLFTRLDGDNFTAPRNIYRMFNDANGDASAWSLPEKIIDSLTTYNSGAIINNPDGSMLVLPANHKVSPNRIITTVYNGDGGWFAPIYSDDGGDTWVAGAKVSVATADEPTISYLINGDLVVNQRTESGSIRITHKSTDGGVTWSLVGTMDGTRNAQVSGSLVQLGDIASPDGVDDLRLVIAGAGEGRVGLTISKINPDLITLDSDYIIKEPFRYVGYLSAKPILNNEYIAVAFEGGTNSNAFNSDNSSYLSVIKI